MIKPNLLNGAGSLFKSVVIKLVQFFPVYGIIFIAYGDRFLPPPMSNWSYTSRTSINQILLGSFPGDAIKNNKYNNKKSDKLIEDLENKNKNR